MMKMGRKKMSRKAQISDTLTWIVATLIIFFIMFFFVAIISLWATKVAVKEKIMAVMVGWKGIEKETDVFSDLFSQKSLISLLNTNIKINGESEKFKDALFYWASSEDKDKVKKEIENKIKEKLDGLLRKDEGYIFYVAYSEKDKEIKDGIYSSGFVQIDGADDYISLSNNFDLYGVAEEAKYALESAATTYVISDKKIKIRLFIGKSKWED